jgi:hypothetical protein
LGLLLLPSLGGRDNFKQEKVHVRHYEARGSLLDTVTLDFLLSRANGGKQGLEKVTA